MRLWTDRFWPFEQGDEELGIPHWTDAAWAEHVGFDGSDHAFRWRVLSERREELRRYELESYAALGRKWEPTIRYVETAKEKLLGLAISGVGIGAAP